MLDSRPGQRRPAPGHRLPARRRRAFPALALALVALVALGACTPAAPTGTASAPAFDAAVLRGVGAPSASFGTVFADLLAQDVAADAGLAPLAGLGSTFDELAGQLVARRQRPSPAVRRPGQATGGAAWDGAATVASVVPAVVQQARAGHVAAVAREARAGQVPADAGASSTSLAGLGYATSSLGDLFGGVSRGAPQMSDTRTVDGAQVTVSMTMSPSGMDLTIDAVKDGQHYSKKSKVHATGDPCPDPSGKVVATIDVDLGEGAGGAAAGLRMQGKVTGTVDDSARLVSMTLDGEHQASVNGTSGRGSVVRQLHSDVQGLADPASSTGSTTASTTMVTGVSDSAAAAGAGAAATQFITFAYGVLLGWQAQWQDGRCVKLAADLKHQVHASTATPFTVTATDSKGASMQVKVTATLASGGVKVDPTTSTTPAKLTYTSPDKNFEKATIALESVSRRGIGRTSVPVTTGADYEASGTSGGLTISGTYVAGSTLFPLQVEFPGGSGTFVYTATSADARSGTLEVDVAGSGATGTGSGTWTITSNDDGTLTLHETVHACVDVSGVCNDTSQTFTLVPKD